VIPALAHIGEESPRGRRSHRSLARRTADTVRHAVSEVLENDEVASGPGLMQRLDPRIKLVSILLFAVSASLAQSILVLLAFVAATAGLAAASGIGVGSFSRKVWASAGFFGLMLSLPAATAWISPGPVLVPLGPLSITSNGLLIAVRLTTRVAAGAGFGLLVVWTTRWTDILQALTAMRMPDIVVATLAMTQQQIMSLLRTVENIHLARESRMLSAGTATDNRAWVTERMAFIAKKSIKTADDVYDAMLSRGFSGAMPSLVRLHARSRDWVWLAASFAVCVLFLGVDRVLMPR
jgi:cobalt/nickel transport system permease protein